MSTHSGNHHTRRSWGRVRSRRRGRIAAAAAIALLVAAGLLVALGFSGGDRISRGVEVGGVDLGGMSKEEARDRKSTRLNSSHSGESRMPSSA